MARDVCEDQRSVSITKCKRWGMLDGGWRMGTLTWGEGERQNSIGYEVRLTGEERWIRFHYRHRSGWGDENWSDCNYRVDLTTTPCRYGGRRYWFLCPLNGCGRRVEKLYFAGKYAGCRMCYNLRYESQKRNWHSVYSRMGRYLDLQEDESKMRIKFWRGIPTKRYARLMRKQEARAASVSLLMRDLQRW